MKDDLNLLKKFSQREGERVWEGRTWDQLTPGREGTFAWKVLGSKPWESPLQQP